MTAEQRTQRWRERQALFRPGAEPFDPHQYGVEALDEAPAKAFVVQHHYSGTYPASRLAVGLFRARSWVRPELVGVAVFSVPMQDRVIPKYAPGVGPREGVELGRFVLLDEVEGNAETWFLARAFRTLRAELAVRAVVSFSDPVRRVAADGRVVLPGHVGTIYQHHNGSYVGRSKARWMHLAPDGRAVSERALAKIRNEERGAAYAYRQLLGMGAPPRRVDEEGPAYVTRAMASMRRVYHPGNHGYVWALDARLSLPAGKPPPKSVDA